MYLNKELFNELSGLTNIGFRLFIKYCIKYKNDPVPYNDSVLEYVSLGLMVKKDGKYYIDPKFLTMEFEFDDLDNYPTTPKEAENNKYIAIYMQITNLFPTDDKYIPIIDYIKLILKKYDYKSQDEIIKAGNKYFANWCSRNTQEGIPYSARNLSWLNWWLNNSIPQIYNNDNFDNQEYNPLEGYTLIK